MAVHRRQPAIIVVDEWRPQLDDISRILRNADRIGQPFASPPALRVALHSALWHAIEAMDEPGDFDVLFAFTEQLAALRRATEETLTEIEAPSIAVRKRRRLRPAGRGGGRAPGNPPVERSRRAGDDIVVRPARPSGHHSGH